MQSVEEERKEQSAVQPKIRASSKCSLYSLFEHNAHMCTLHYSNNWL